MSEGVIKTNPGDGGPQLDAEVIVRIDSTDSTTVYRERNQVTGDTRDAIMAVLNVDPPNTGFGGVVRVAGGVYIAEEQWVRLICAMEATSRNVEAIARTLTGDQ
ncbi:MAG: hypothetical protein EPN91_04890 [Salinibacterium sp.]|nr:MAG: hypothetical protein EPN91_04890 [Salinibacterium sp.]